MKIFGIRIILLSSVTIIATTLILCGLMTNFYLFALCFAIGVGFPCGIIFIIPLKILSAFFKEAKGKAIGFCMTFTGISAVLL